MPKLLATLLFAIGLYHPTVFGGPRQDLVNQSTRPTMANIFRFFSDYDKDLSAPKHHFSRGWFYRHQINEVAEFIVMLERSFPGAYFYELGRDAVFLGDILDAFYISIGQPDRVRRLDASAQSFVARDPKLVYDFMATNGINLDQARPEWPHIIFDVTSFNKKIGIGTGDAGSQSVQLMRAGYQHYISRYGKQQATGLLPYFNFVSVSAFNSQFVDMRKLNFRPEEFFQEQALQMEQDIIFDVPFFADLSVFTYTDAWHNYFGPFYRANDGGVLTTPGPMSGKDTRKRILRSMVAIMKSINTPEFRQAIVRQANLRGFEFPVERSSTLRFINPAPPTCDGSIQ